jgi:hypothetical protein
MLPRPRVKTGALAEYIERLMNFGPKGLRDGHASPALVPQKPLDISFAFLYREEWNDSTRSSARYQLLNPSR